MAPLGNKANVFLIVGSVLILLGCSPQRPNLAAGWVVDRTPWRPKGVGRIQFEPNEPCARRLSNSLVYGPSDIDILWDIALSLNRDDATRFFEMYVTEYWEGNKLVDATWGRGVFCLGVVQTETGKRALLRLWDRYDNLLATGKLKVEIADIWKGRIVYPLEVIADALHFYLWDPEVREWFNREIDKGEKLEEPRKLDFARSSRQTGRRHLLTHLYFWDIIESVDRDPNGAREELSGYYSQQEVKNIEKSADSVVYWVKRLRPLAADTTKMEWMKIRGSPREYRLDVVAGGLGKPLAITLWRKYLEQEGPEIAVVRHRLWLISLWTYSRSFATMYERTWVPDGTATVFLKDAIAYATSLPDGHIRKLVVEVLFKMSYYSPEAVDNEQIKQIREISQIFLSEADRLGVVSNADMNMRTARAVRRRGQQESTKHIN